MGYNRPPSADRRNRGSATVHGYVVTPAQLLTLLGLLSYSPTLPVQSGSTLSTTLSTKPRTHQDPAVPSLLLPALLLLTGLTMATSNEESTVNLNNLSFSNRTRTVEVLPLRSNSNSNLRRRVS